MPKYFSYEMFISSLLANYRTTISIHYIANLIDALKKANPSTMIARDSIKNINKYIGYCNGYIWLKGNLDDIVEDNMTLKEYLNKIGGYELQLLMEGIDKNRDNSVQR